MGTTRTPLGRQARSSPRETERRLGLCFTHITTLSKKRTRASYRVKERSELTSVILMSHLPLIWTSTSISVTSQWRTSTMFRQPNAFAQTHISSSSFKTAIQKLKLSKSKTAKLLESLIQMTPRAQMSLLARLKRLLLILCKGARASSRVCVGSLAASWIHQPSRIPRIPPSPIRPTNSKSKSMMTCAREQWSPFK